MNLSEIIQKRRSIRVFEDKLIEKKIIETIINAGIQAPSACNIQGWRFIIITETKTKEKIFNAGGSILIKKAPVGILVIYDRRTKNTEYNDYIQSASAAMQNIILSSTELGLGTCWINHLPPKKFLKKLFNIPSEYTPIAYLLLGYPKEGKQIATIQRKYKLNEILSYNTFGEGLAIEKINNSKILLEKILMKIYYFIPIFIKKRMFNKFLDKHFVKKFKN